MKYAKTLKIFGIAVVLSLLMIAIPAAPALAYDIEIDPEEGTIGDEIYITGDGFTASSETVERQVMIFFSNEEGTLTDFIDDDIENYEIVGSELIGYFDDPDEGEFETTFDVPAVLTDGDDDVDVTSGTYYIYVTTIYSDTDPGKDIRAMAEFTVIAGEVSIDPDEGPVDSFVEIIGSAFGSRQDIEIEFDGDSLPIEGDDETDSDGEFESFIIIPESYAGDHDITIIVGSSEVEVEFTVESDIIITPQYGEAGTEVTVSGTGFARRPKEVYVYFDNTQIAPTTMDSKGSFSMKFNVPEGLTAGVYDIEAEDTDRNTATASFTLNVPTQPEPSPEPEPTPGPKPGPAPSKTALNINQSGDTIGSLIGIGGSGFIPNSTVTLKYDDIDVATALVGADGLFMVTFQAPPSQHGAHIITVSDGINTNTVNFIVESVAPPVPPPLLPEMGVKVKSPVYFDWEEVSDESAPVTYILQIADDDDFSPDSIVLQKTGLEESEYTLTEEEELELTGREEPYYWRLRAVDAALNESDWTGAGEIYVGAPFDFPNWALYTILGIGAVLIFGIGYWLGRRTAFYY